MALIPVVPGDVATIVTSLEMTRRPALRPLPPSPLRITRWTKPAPDRYRALFARIGAPWLWFSRLAMSDTDLTRIIHDDAVSIFAVVDRAGIEVGMLELDFRTADACQISFLGVIPELAGQGHGRWLMAQALAHAWVGPVRRVWVHSCTLDHPAALPFYIRSGFTPFARAIETFPDPRIAGILPRDSAPQIPLLDSARR